MFVRVRDKDTGHEYDVWETAIRPEAHKILPDYPASVVARPAKHRTTKSGKPAHSTGRPAKSDKE